MSTDKPIKFSLSSEWWESKNGGISFPCPNCDEKIAIKLKEAKIHVHKEKLKVEPIDAWAVVSGVGTIVSVSLETEEDAWYMASDKYRFKGSYEETALFLKDSGYRCIRVTITPQ